MSPNNVKADMNLLATKDKTLHELFEEQVSRTPDAPAIYFNTDINSSRNKECIWNWTYKDLNSKANQLAQMIKENSTSNNAVCDGQPLIAILLPERQDFLLASLAVLKSGGAFVPISMEYPLNHLQRILEDTGNPLLITSQSALTKLQFTWPYCIFIDIPALKTESKVTNLNLKTVSNSLAYVIYTSGSTGIPKGVMVEHRSVVNLVQWQVRTFKLTMDDRSSLFNNTAFDGSIVETWPCLLIGGSLHVIPNAYRFDPAELVKWTIDNSITIQDLPTVMGNAFIKLFQENHEENSVRSSLRFLTIGGDKANDFYPESLPFQVVNSYGPTETTVQATICFLNSGELKKSSTTGVYSPPIGKPIDNVQIYIWNKDADEPLEVGQVGEIWIGGAGVARGYLNRPQLTKEKFIKNPFKGKHGRIYQTGDLGQWLPCGNLEYKCRLDDQVKIRGFRVQPRDIEFILEKIPAVLTAAVVTRQADPEELGKQLAAFIVLNKIEIHGRNQSELLKDFKIHCTNNCPQFMIPVLWEFLPELPLTPSGKVDRKKLVALAQNTLKVHNYTDNYKAPISKKEKKIASIWGAVLDVPINLISMSDNFFALGGHSLLVIQVINRVRKEFGISNISPTLLFKYPNLQDFVEQLETLLLTMDFSPPEDVSSLHTSRTIFPLSFPQQLIWLHMEKAGAFDMYNEINWITIPEATQISTLEKSINFLYERHEALRTTISITNGQPMQQFQKNHNWQPLQIIKFGNVDKKCQEKLIKQWSIDEYQKNLNLSTGPLVKFFLLQMNANTNMLVIISHHLVMDGVSLAQIILPELTFLYQQEIGSSTADISKILPPLKFHYSDHLEQQLQKYHTQNAAYNNSVAFWKAKLANLNALALPQDRVKSCTSSSNLNGNSFLFEIPAEVIEILNEICKKYQTTPYIALLTTLNILLFRYTDQEDITVCGISAGRDEMDSEKLVGHFTNLVIFRNEITPTLTFVELLKKVTKSAMEVFEHQNLPFLKILSELDLDYSHINQTLASVVLSMELEPPTNPLGWHFHQLHEQNRANKFDLSIRVEQTATQMNALIQYNANIFNESTIQRFSSHFLTLLKEICIYSETKSVSSLNILPATELDLIINFLTMNNSTTYPSTKTIHELFEEQVTKTPNKIAIKDDTGESLTYEELNQKSNKLAQILQSTLRQMNAGIAGDIFVVILLPQSINFVVSTMAVLKAGAALIPINDDYPLERIKFILNDSNCHLVISNTETVQKCCGLSLNSDDETNERRILNLDNVVSDVPTDMPLTQLETTNSADSLAYVIYTSGSTGKPKGVMVTHKNVVNFSYFHINEKNIATTDTSALIASPGFDIFIFESFPYLLIGATLSVAPSDVKKEPKKLLHWFQRERITIAYLTAALAEPFIKLNFTSEKLSLRKLYTGGDSLSFYPDTSLPFDVVNSYGPTETTISATELNLKGYTKTSAIPPIGRPMSNYKIYILDKLLQPVPIGITGEIYIAGDGLARGYLNRPKLTKEKYIRNPFSSDDTFHRLYKTGDLARWLIDGNIHFQGRSDEQVKIRGFRVELGEIQSLLDVHTSVQQAVVLTRDLNNCDKEIVCYIQSTVEADKSNEYPEDLLKEQFKCSQKLFEEVYRPLETTEIQNDETMMMSTGASTIGWINSFTGQPIPQPEMDEWVQDTITQIMEFKPKRILEIGCGTGLLMEKISPFADSYTATDFSSTAIDSIRRRLESRRTNNLKCSITLINRAGDVFEKEEHQSYDMVIINSVVQYFPDLSYLKKVLDGAIWCTEPGGHIFIGDIRSLQHLESYHGAVAAHKLAYSGITYGEWRTIVSEAVQMEEELVIHPSYFNFITDGSEQLSHVTTNLRRGFYKNEMTCFRYNAVLHSHLSENSVSAAPITKWMPFTSLTNLEKLLQEKSNSADRIVLAIAGIPNFRVFNYVNALKFIPHSPNVPLNPALKKYLNSANVQTVDPELLASFAEVNGYSVQLTFSSEKPENFDAIFFKGYNSTDHIAFETISKIKFFSKYANTNYSNQPMKHKNRQTLLCTLKEYLRDKLPSYMIPSAWVFVDAIPTTTNGKVDKKSLTTLNLSGQIRDKAFTPASNTLETNMSKIWADLLNRSMSTISSTDNFFEIGGNSLLAIRLLETIRQEYHIEIPLRSLFQSAELNQICKLIEQNHFSGKLDSTELDHSVILMEKAQYFDQFKKPPVFFIHPVGGTVFCYKPISKYIGILRDFYAIQDPNIQTDKVKFTTVEEMASFYIQLIRNCVSNGPIVIGGHSFGGLVAFEIAKQLGPENVELVILLDSAPEIFKGDESSGRELNRKILLQCHKEMQNEKYKQIIDSDLNKWLKLGSHRFQMALNYIPSSIDSKVLFCKAAEEFEEENAIIMGQLENSELFSWQSVCDQPIKEFIADGNHDTMLLEPNVKKLAHEILKLLS